MTTKDLTTDVTYIFMSTAVKQWIDEEEGNDDDIPRIVLYSAEAGGSKRKHEAELLVDEAVKIALAANAYLVDKRFADDGIEDALKAGKAFALKIVGEAQHLKTHALHERGPSPPPPTFDVDAIVHAFALKSSFPAL